MNRRYLVVGVTLSLLVLYCASAAMAQSGRGRQLRIREAAGGDIASPIVTSEEQPASSASESAPHKITLPRSSLLIYHDNVSKQAQDSGAYHMTKADKRAGWILLGAVVVETIIMIANHGEF